MARSIFFYIVLILIAVAIIGKTDILSDFFGALQPVSITAVPADIKAQLQNPIYSPPFNASDSARGYCDDQYGSIVIFRTNVMDGNYQGTGKWIAYDSGSDGIMDIRLRYSSVISGTLICSSAASTGITTTEGYQIRIKDNSKYIICKTLSSTGGPYYLIDNSVGDISPVPNPDYKEKYSTGKQAELKKYYCDASSKKIYYKECGQGATAQTETP